MVNAVESVSLFDEFLLDLGLQPQSAIAAAAVTAAIFSVLEFIISPNLNSMIFIFNMLTVSLHSADIVRNGYETL